MSGDLDRFGFSSYEGFNAQLIRWRYEHLRRYFRGTACLELGCSDGQGTAYLLDHFSSVTAVDGSPGAVSDLRQRFPEHRLEAVCSTFETLRLGRRFDTVLLAHVLEHVEDPQHLLNVGKAHLADGGVLIVDVPNAHSIHRQMGVEMGMLGAVTDLNEADISIGHRRVYTPDSFIKEVETAGLRILEFGGLFLKVLANHQIESTFDELQRSALLEIGTRYPEIASEIYVVAGR